MRHALRAGRAAAGWGTAGLLTASCAGGPGATVEDETACATLQRMAMALAERRSQDAMAALTSLRPEVGAASDPQLRGAGDRFFAVILAPVEDENEMTLGESLEVGQVTRAEGAAELGRMIDACGRLGRRITDLPAGGGAAPARAGT
ncbi:MAG: hypothetical protein ACRDPR_18590 [Nocardioidaceae bacterium]